MAWNLNQQPQQQQPLTVPHVCVLIPHTGHVSLEFVESTYAPLKFLPRADFAKSIKLSKGVPLHITRNELVKLALEDKTVTHLLFVDSDMIAESPSDVNESVRYLLACNTPIVSALYRAKKSKGDYPYAMWAKHPQSSYGYIGFDKWTGNFISADVVGFGFILIKREVFEKVPYPWFVWNEVAPSEDFYACEQFKKHGYEIKVYTDCKFSHSGEMKVKIDGNIHVLDV